MLYHVSFGAIARYDVMISCTCNHNGAYSNLGPATLLKKCSTVGFSQLLLSMTPFWWVHNWEIALSFALYFMVIVFNSVILSCYPMGSN
jgi:hypothetical protein